MINLFKQINKKINSLIWSLAFTGIVLLVLSLLIVGTDYTLRIIVGLVTLLVAYIFLLAAYKVSVFKKVIKKHFKL